MTQACETAVIGGGVIGLAVAHELARRGRSDVLVLERDRAGHGATWAAAGMLAPHLEAEHEPPELVALGRASLERFPDFVAGLESASGMTCGYRREGTLWVALQRDDRAELEQLAARLAGKGIRPRRLDPATLEELEPHLSGRAVGGLHCPEDQQVDPRRLVAALRATLEASGGRVIEGVRVDAFDSGSDGVCTVGGRDAHGEPIRVRARRVVLAAGAWSFHGIRLPLADPGVRPIKGQLLRLRGPAVLRHVVRTPRVYLVPRADGELLVGATMEDAGFDARTTAGATMDLLRHAWEAVPATYDFELAECCVGFRSAVSDHLPRIGPAGVDGLFLALGHGRHGVLLAPLGASLLVDAMLDGPVPVALEPFLPGRARAAAPRTGRARAQ